MFGRKKKRERELAEVLASDAPRDRLFAAVHGGARAVIDGDAVASYGWPHLSVDVRRGALVDYLGTWAKVVSADQPAIWVFFDESMDPAIPRSKAITIERTEDRNAAAGRAIEEIDSADAAVGVWSDANAMSLRAAGATLFQADDLLDAFLDLSS